MAASSYKGDTAAKIVARSTFWEQMSRVLDSRNAEDIKAFVLASKFCGDLAYLDAHGILRKNILACDVDPEAMQAAQRRFPGVKLHFGRYQDAAKAHARAFHAVFLDTQHSLSAAVANEMVKAAFSLAASKAIIGFAYVVGREITDDIASAQSQVDELLLALVEDEHAITDAIAAGIIPEGMDVEQAKKYVLDSADDGSARARVLNLAVRYQMGKGQNLSLAVLGTIKYQSADENGQGTPMEILMYDFARLPGKPKREMALARARFRHVADVRAYRVACGFDGDVAINKDADLPGIRQRLESASDLDVDGIMNVGATMPLPPPEPRRTKVPSNGDEILITGDDGWVPAVCRRTKGMTITAVSLDSSRTADRSIANIRWADGSIVGARAKEITQMNAEQLVRVEQGSIEKGESLWLKDGKHKRHYRKVRTLKVSQKGAYIELVASGTHGVKRFAYHNELFREKDKPRSILPPAPDKGPAPKLNKQRGPGTAKPPVIPPAPATPQVEPSRAATLGPCPVKYEVQRLSTWSKAFRKFLRLKQLELAAATSIPSHRISKMERAEHVPTDGDVLNLAEYVGQRYSRPTLADLMAMRDADTKAGVRALQRTFEVVNKRPASEAGTARGSVASRVGPLEPQPPIAIPPIEEIEAQRDYRPDTGVTASLREGTVTVELKLSDVEELALHRSAAESGKTLAVWLEEKLMDALTS
jgi:transcriptional regulator with XRE-family HTH domain